MSALSWLTHARERFAHDGRRRDAWRMLETTPPARNILVVCEGNLCRSPFAAALLRRELDRQPHPPDVSSAGYGSANQRSPAEAVAAAEPFGVDLSGHRSRQIGRALLEAAELIVVMDDRLAAAVRARHANANRGVVVLGDLDPAPIHTRAIVDPMGRSRAVFDVCYARIDRCVAQLSRAIGARRHP